VEDRRTLKSTPIVAVELSESNWSSQYRISTVHCEQGPCLHGGMLSLHADFPAPEGPIIRIFSVGNDSSEAIFANNFGK